MKEPIVVWLNRWWRLEPIWRFKMNPWSSPVIYGASIFEAYEDEDPIYNIYDMRFQYPIYCDGDLAFLGFEYFEEKYSRHGFKDRWRHLSVQLYYTRLKLCSLTKEKRVIQKIHWYVPYCSRNNTVLDPDCYTLACQLCFERFNSKPWTTHSSTKEAQVRRTSFW